MVSGTTGPSETHLSSRSGRIMGPRPILAGNTSWNCDDGFADDGRGLFCVSVADFGAVRLRHTSPDGE